VLKHLALYKLNCLKGKIMYQDMCYSEIKMMKYLPTSETADLVNQLFSSEKAYTAQRFQGSSLQIGTVKDSDMKSNIAVKAGFVCVCVCVGGV
jgi:hypothetical protein